MTFLIGLAVRLVLIPITEDPWDMPAWREFGRQLTSGVPLYQIDYYLPYVYPPLWGWFCYVVEVFAGLFGGSAYYVLGRIALKLPALLGDVLLFFAISRIAFAVGASKRKADLATAFYFLNPAVIAITAMWGMFDSLATALLAIAIVLAPGKPARSGIVFGLSACLKGFYTAYLGPLFLAYYIGRKRYKEAGVFFISMAIVPLLVSLPYLISDPIGYFDGLFHHASRDVQVINLWTFLDWTLYLNQYVVNALAHFATVILLPIAVLFVAARTGSGFRTLKSESNVGVEKTMVEGWFLLIAVFFLISTIVNPQYFVWIAVPGAVLAVSRGKFALKSFYILSVILAVELLVHIGPRFFVPIGLARDEWWLGWGISSRVIGICGLLVWCVVLIAGLRLLRRRRGNLRTA